MSILGGFFLFALFLGVMSGMFTSAVVVQTNSPEVYLSGVKFFGKHGQITEQTREFSKKHLETIKKQKMGFYWLEAPSQDTSKLHLFYGILVKDSTDRVEPSHEIFMVPSRNVLRGTIKAATSGKIHGAVDDYSKKYKVKYASKGMFEIVELTEEYFTKNFTIEFPIVE